MQGSFSLSSELVVRETESVRNCITEHPGFNPVCLQRWSLRLAAGRFKTKTNQRYHQTGDSEGR